MLVSLSFEFELIRVRLSIDAETSNGNLTTYDLNSLSVEIRLTESPLNLLLQVLLSRVAFADRCI